MKTVWIEQNCTLPVALSDKVEKRVRAIEELGYEFKYESVDDNKVAVVCMRTNPNRDAIVRRVHTWASMGVAFTEVINRAYNILYGEENDDAT